LLLGFWMSVYHITYYDAMFTALPMALLLCVPAFVSTPYFFRHSRLEWDGTGPVEGWKMALPPGKFGVICNPLIVLLLPVILWDDVVLPRWLVLRVWYLPRHWLFGTEVPDVTDVYWLNIPVIVPCFMLLWVWVGWMWLRERPIVDCGLRVADSQANALASNPHSAIPNPPSGQLAKSS
jgi:hypothetical protein